jgi:bifunctional enzyme CysN/CysC
MSNTAIEERERLHVAFIGHVDHGKSTVVGRLLAETNSLPEGKLERVQALCRRNGEPFEYAYLIDALKEERAQSITIDAARVFFSSKKRDYVIMDAPGHIEFIRNMVTGAARAEAAVLVIDAKEGVMENSRRHGYLAWMLGIRQLIVVVNKMDLVDYDRKDFRRIRRKYGNFLREIGLNPLAYIPVSGSAGDLIESSSANMAWYKGDSLLKALDHLTKSTPLSDQSFRMPVQDIYKFNGSNGGQRILAGSITSGKIKAQDEIVFYPSMKHSQVNTIEAYNEPEKTIAKQGEAIGLTLKEQVFIERGEIAALAGESAPHISTRMHVSLFWLGKQPMVKGKHYLFKLGTSRVKVQIEKIIKVINAAEISSDAIKDHIALHDVAECVLETQKAVAFDLTDSLSDTSRFVIVDENEICGGGIILESLPDNQQTVRAEKLLREQKWISSDITPQERANRYQQEPKLVIITGKRDTGRKTLARALEKELFSQGKFVYYLGMGSVVYGINQDIGQNGSLEHRREHIRRLSEVVHILMDTGLVVLVTALELNCDDLKMIETLVDTRDIKVVWVGDAATTGVPVDLFLGKETQTEERVLKAKYLITINDID